MSASEKNLMTQRESASATLEGSNFINFMSFSQNSLIIVIVGNFHIYVYYVDITMLYCAIPSHEERHYVSSVTNTSFDDLALTIFPISFVKISIDFSE